jgi:hypothetical protein
VGSIPLGSIPYEDVLGIDALRFRRMRGCDYSGGLRRITIAKSPSDIDGTKRAEFHAAEFHAARLHAFVDGVRSKK